MASDVPIANPTNETQARNFTRHLVVVINEIPRT